MCADSFEEQMPGLRFVSTVVSTCVELYIQVIHRVCTILHIRRRLSTIQLLSMLQIQPYIDEKLVHTIAWLSMGCLCRREMLLW